MDGLLDISISSLIAGLIFSAIGIWMWKQAKQKRSFQLHMIAAALFIYAYFTPNAFLTWAVGIGLCVYAKVIWDSE